MTKHSVQKKKTMIGAIIKLISRLKKKDEKADEFAFEREICRKKLLQLEKCLQSSHNLTIGVRSERMRIEKVKDATEEGAVVTYPTVCELLGGEYSVHFDFCGKDMVGRYDAKDKITVSDRIAVYFDKADMQLFDPITGDVIR